ncbi:hypothetical protein ACFQYP_13745 [Nonomuraea antimicrobica]
MRIHRRGTRPVAAVVAVLVAALATAGVLYASGAIGRPAEGDRPTSQALPETSPTRETTSGPAPTPSPAREATSGPAPTPSADRETTSGTTPLASGSGQIPETFAGTWTGQVVSQDDRQKPVEITITLAAGQRTGTWASGACTLTATLTSVDGDTVLNMTVAQRDQCVGGDMTLTLNDPDALTVVQQEGASALEYRGDLRRS